MNNAISTKRDRSADRGIIEQRNRNDQFDQARLVYFDLGNTTEKSTKTIDYIETDGSIGHKQEGISRPK